jgi:hypothetical protein
MSAGILDRFGGVASLNAKSPPAVVVFPSIRSIAIAASGNQYPRRGDPAICHLPGAAHLG